MRFTPPPEGTSIQQKNLSTREVFLGLVGPLPLICLLHLMGVSLWYLLPCLLFLPSLLLLLLFLHLGSVATSRWRGKPDASVQTLPASAESSRGA